MRRALVLGISAAAAFATTGGATATAAPPGAQPMRIYVIDSGAGTQHKGALYRIDTAGQRTLLTDFGFQSHLPGVKREPLGKFPTAVAVEQDGTILVLDREAGGHGELFTVDRGTGTRAVLTGFGDATQGPKGKQPAGVAVAPDGTILVSDTR